MFIAPGSIGKIGNPHAPKEGVGVYPPPGYAFVIDEDGAYLVDSDGAYLITEIV